MKIASSFLVALAILSSLAPASVSAQSFFAEFEGVYSRYMSNGKPPLDGCGVAMGTARRLAEEAGYPRHVVWRQLGVIFLSVCKETVSPRQGAIGKDFTYVAKGLFRKDFDFHLPPPPRDPPVVEANCHPNYLTALPTEDDPTPTAVCVPIPKPPATDINCGGGDAPGPHYNHPDGGVRYRPANEGDIFNLDGNSNEILCDDPHGPN